MNEVILGCMDYVEATEKVTIITTLLIFILFFRFARSIAVLACTSAISTTGSVCVPWVLAITVECQVRHSAIAFSAFLNHSKKQKESFPCHVVEL